MAAEESFEQDGAWIRSSNGFQVRSLGRSGMEYVRGSLRLCLDTEALATPGFMLNPRALPDDLRERVVEDVIRAWRWYGYEILIPEPFDWESIALRPPQEREAKGERYRAEHGDT